MILDHFTTYHRPAWVEIDLDCVRHNIRGFQRIIPDSTQMMAVVKADAYGHGAYHVAKAALQAGASRLAVAIVEEGIVLRRLGITAPIHILGVSAPGTERAVIEYDVIPTICSIESARRFSAVGTALGRTITCHVKIDTGMGRIGVLPGELTEFLRVFNTLPNLDLEGVLSHFSKADEIDKTYTNRQLGLYQKCLEMFAVAGISPRLRCLANSAGTIDLPASLFDMVRIGIALYGLYPSADVQTTKIHLRPVMSWKTRIVHLKTLPPGERISYGGVFITSRSTKVATLPVGYADGYRRRLGNTGGQVLIRGQRAPIIGRVCMDMCMIDVTDIAHVTIGDEAVLIGTQGDDRISADEMATQLDTINYEITCLVGKRVPRLFLEAGEVEGISSLLGEHVM
jgi:alanine racemase